MTRRIIATSSVFLFVSALPGCGIFGSDRSGPAQVSDLVTCVEKVYVDAELSRTRVQTAIQKLQALASPDVRGNQIVIYNELLVNLKQSQEQADKLRGSVEPMKEIAPRVFDTWSTDLGGFSSSGMRLRSEARLSATRERYQAVVNNVDPAQSAYDAFNRGLQDHALFLGHDLNPAAVSDLRDDVRSLTKLATELEGRFEACMQAARAYVQAAGMQQAAEPPAAAPTPTGR